MHDMDKKLFITVIVLCLLGSVLFATYQIFAPFITSLIWASFIVIIFYPLHKKLLKKFPERENLAALLMCTGLIILVLLPASLLLIVLLKQLVEGAQLLTHIIQSFDFQELLNWPIIVKVKTFAAQYVDLESIDIKGALLNSAQNISAVLIENSKSFLAALSGFFILLALIGMNMFFLFRDGQKLMDYLKWMIPVSDELKSQIIGRTKEVITASIFGGVVTAVVQGFLGGFAFFILGISSSILWGVLMGILSFLPMAGPPVIWAPAALWLLFSGHVIKGIFMIFWGVVVVGMSDNILRPLLISKVSSESTRLNTLVLFLSVLGGLKVFGFMGLVMGPLTVVMAMTLIEICRLSFAPEGVLIMNDMVHKAPEVAMIADELETSSDIVPNHEDQKNED